ncbi:chaplin [Nostoc sp. ChiVER01]|uniref:chaplin n=1 Tax=Nostoc sp. ChiVER01 TaxID=3075382 RepID=UPI002AD1DC54|nr:chaplin [Nostoc sp. ChiVER01]MDZ8226300.1 chaplin [Nostoc sp. ChiVER01]
MLKIFSTKKQATKQTPTLIQQDLELFEELDDADLLAIVGGVDANVSANLSGNVVQVPVHIPVNVCGNTVNVIGLLNPAFGNTCVNA